MNRTRISHHYLGRLGRLSGLASGGAAVIVAVSAAAAPSARPGAVTSLPGNLSGVAAVSASDAWAVGASDSIGPGQVLHWDGTSWTKTAVPDTGLGSLAAVSALSAKNAWTVGSRVTATGLADLVLHWNGTNWARVPAPSPGSRAQLSGVTALSPSNAWAVGAHGSVGAGTSFALALHWNGTSWTRTPTPRTGSSTELLAVDALFSHDVWAVGDYAAKTDASQKALVLHWNGTGWTRVPSPDLGYSQLFGVAAQSATDAWAVGYDFAASGAQRSVTLHWNGTRWTRVPSPDPGGAGGSAYTTLSSVTALSPTDAWAAGKYGVGSRTQNTLILHWNGTRWARVPSPSPTDSGLNGVAAVSPSKAWAVGGAGETKGGAGTTLLLHWNGTSWTRS